MGNHKKRNEFEPVSILDEMFSLSGHGIRAVVLGIDNLLLRSTASSDAARRMLFHRMVLDPREEPLSALFSSKEGIAAQAPRLLAPFFAGFQPPPSYLKMSVLDGYEGSSALREELNRIQASDIRLAIWDNCLSGSTSHVHSLIDRYYGGLFPRSYRFFSTSHHTSLGKKDFMEILFKGLSARPDELLVVTANPGQRDYALRCGMRSLWVDPAEQDAPSFSMLASFTTYLGVPGGSRIQDPLTYLAAVGDCVNDDQVDRRIRALPESHPLKADVKKIRDDLIGSADSGAIGLDIRCLLVDQRLHAEGGLVSFLEEHSLPRFKPADEVYGDVLRLADGYLAQVERRIPNLARSALEALMRDIAPLCKINDPSFLATGIVQEIERRVRNHILLNHRLYVVETGVFRDEEWAELSEIFHLDHDVLDQHYEKWIVDTERLLREMVAKGKPLKAARRMVKERLIDDLVLTVMELEMMVRSFEEKTPRPVLFPRHHDAKNRAVSLTLNIDDKKAWKESILLTTKTVQGWMQGLVMGRLRQAKDNSVSLKFSFARDASLPSMELSDLGESEREDINNILTELMANAIKYRNQDEETSEVRVDVIEGEGMIVVSVADNGVGIADIRKVFDGVREHPEGKEGYGGGLVSILRHIKAHEGWDLGVVSDPGVGSRFTLTAVLVDRDCQKRRMTESGFPIV